jgi:predicted ArsR family transcriptional regulator
MKIKGTYNKLKILALIKDNGPMTRKELLKHFNVSRLALKEHIDFLMKRKLIYEDKKVIGQKGRRPIKLYLINKNQPISLNILEDLWNKLQEITSQLEETGEQICENKKHNSLKEINLLKKELIDD